MVGNATKRLDAHHVVDALTSKSGNLARNEPSLSVLVEEVDTLSRQLGFLANALDRTIANKLAQRFLILVAIGGNDFFRQATNNIQRMLARQDVLQTLGFRVDKALREEVGHRRYRHLDALRDEPLHNAIIAKIVVLDVDFANDANDLRLRTNRNSVELLDGLAKQRNELRTLVLLKQTNGFVDVLLLETVAISLMQLARYGGIVQARQGVSKAQGVQHGEDNLLIVEVKSRLVIDGTCRNGERYDRNILITSVDKGSLDEGDVVGSTTLARRLRDAKDNVIEVVLATLNRGNEVARDAKRRIADFIVDRLKSHVKRFT